MRKLFPAVRGFIHSDLTRNFAGGFAVGAVALLGVAAKAEAATGLFL